LFLPISNKQKKNDILFYKITEFSRTPVTDSKKLPGEIFKRAIPTDLAKKLHGRAVVEKGWICLTEKKYCTYAEKIIFSSTIFPRIAKVFRGEILSHLITQEYFVL